MFSIKTLKILTLSVGLACSPFALSAPATDQDLNQLIKLSELDVVFNQGLQELKPFFDDESKKIVMNIVGTAELNSQQLKVAQNLSQAMSQNTEVAIQNPQIKEKLKETLKNIYTAEEVKAYNAFLSTPAGQSINRKSPKVTIEVQKFMEQIILESSQNGAIAEQVEAILAPLLEK